MTTSCGPTIMLKGSTNDAGVLPADADHHLAQAQELALAQSLMIDHINRLMPGPARAAGGYQIQTGGSLLRARLAIASGLAFDCSKSFRISSAAACEFVHNASLVHDDLLDRDSARRDVPSVWKQYGDAVALCAGDLLLCAAFGVAADLENPAESRLLSQHIAAMASRIIVGQSMEVAHLQKYPLPRFRAYLEATIAKTAPLIELPLIAAATAGGADQYAHECIRQLASAIGLAYQIIDDLDDLNANRRSLHPFHAWHHHQQGQEGDPELRIRRATQHAIASLNRARRLLGQFERKVTMSLGPTVEPLLSKLEQRALAHSRSHKLAGEPLAYESVIAG
ncbi:MAG TPA: polyprenyl synthetase family protein [Marinobacter sp.]|nr:polyprenyl synthetase family protein [Marinobacter sp.]